MISWRMKLVSSSSTPPPCQTDSWILTEQTHPKNVQHIGNQNRGISNAFPFAIQLYPRPPRALSRRLRTYGATLCNICNVLQPSRNCICFGIRSSVILWPWVIRHSSSPAARSAQHRSCPCRYISRAERSQPNPSRPPQNRFGALQSRLFPPPRRFFFDQTNPNSPPQVSSLQVFTFPSAQHSSLVPKPPSRNT